jgi:hypothetical protein
LTGIGVLPQGSWFSPKTLHVLQILVSWSVRQSVMSFLGWSQSVWASSWPISCCFVRKFFIIARSAGLVVSIIVHSSGIGMVFEEGCRKGRLRLMCIFGYMSVSDEVYAMMSDWVFK